MKATLALSETQKLTRTPHPVGHYLHPLHKVSGKVLLSPLPTFPMRELGHGEGTQLSGWRPSFQPRLVLYFDTPWMEQKVLGICEPGQRSPHPGGK